MYSAQNVIIVSLNCCKIYDVKKNPANRKTSDDF